jgi:phospholipid transport system substrate-binding protein
VKLAIRICAPTGEVDMRYAGRFASFLVLLALAGFPATTYAQAQRTSPDKAAQFVHEFGGKVVAVLGRSGSTDAQLRQEIETLIRDSVDIEAIGRSSLGSAWQRASEAQRKDFQEQFAVWATSTYAERLGGNRGGSLTVLSYVGTNNDAYVRTKVARADGRSSLMDLRVRENQGRMRIVDAEVDGISMDMTQRDEFASVVRRQGIDALIASLKTQAKPAK